MSPVHFRNLGILRSQPEDIEGLFKTRRPGREHLGHSGGWQDTEGNHTHSDINITILQKPQTRGMEGYGSSSSAPPAPQRSFTMEHGQQEVQPSIPLGRTWRKLPEDISQRDKLQRSYEEHLSQARPALIPSGSEEVDQPNSPVSSHHSGTKKISGQESPFLAIPHSFQENTRIKAQKQAFFEPKAEKVRPNYPEAVGLGEGSTQEPGIVVNTSRISIPTHRAINPTQNEHNVVPPEISLNSDALWLQMSQFSEKSQKQSAELQDSHINPQPQGHVLDKRYQQEDIKPEVLLANKGRSPSQYQDGDKMLYSEKEELKQLPEASSWPRFSFTGEYDHMEFIDHIYVLLIDKPRIPDYWITARLNTAFKGHASIWYTEMKKIHGRRNWQW
ncbi:hypothetical protein O181_082310 [Austropuccinia psidii MF-1]|uniref:Uncharacterized protein n=1 Tax=Austropuccinia psidii MF-1 TaxID=1389203 RepID=A0A9Q3FKU8_9BASI|nr:hypothetical protein [Austropuccinia psidii MF-1]